MRSRFWFVSWLLAALLGCGGAPPPRAAREAPPVEAESEVDARAEPENDPLLDAFFALRAEQRRHAMEERTGDAEMAALRRWLETIDALLPRVASDHGEGFAAQVRAVRDDAAVHLDRVEGARNERAAGNQRRLARSRLSGATEVAILGVALGSDPPRRCAAARLVAHWRFWIEAQAARMLAAGAWGADPALLQTSYVLPGLAFRAHDLEEQPDGRPLHDSGALRGLLYLLEHTRDAWDVPLGEEADRLRAQVDLASVTDEASARLLVRLVMELGSRAMEALVGARRPGEETVRPAASVRARELAMAWLDGSGSAAAVERLRAEEGGPEILARRAADLERVRTACGALP